MSNGTPNYHRLVVIAGLIWGMAADLMAAPTEHFPHHLHTRIHAQEGHNREGLQAKSKFRRPTPPLVWLAMKEGEDMGQALHVSDPYPNCKNILSFSHPLDWGAQVVYGSFFPNLNFKTARITSIATHCYNCVAWSLGITDDWLWPADKLIPSAQSTRLEDFDKFYGKLGYKRVEDPKEATIAVWAVTPPRGEPFMTHASVIRADYQGQWSSKLGAMVRMRHDPRDLEGDQYGKAIAYYRKIANEDLLKLRAGLFSSPQLAPLSRAQYAKLGHKIHQLSSDFLLKFDTRYEAWKETWFKGAERFSSDPASRTNSAEFKALVEMGPAILPLVVKHLLNPEEFMALQLYDTLQTKQELKVRYGEGFPIYGGEKGRARKTTKLYVKAL
ncbi:MAG: hypothetical protein WDW20_05830 [Neisseriaceae bacterium]